MAIKLGSRVVGALMGDINHEPSARTKYGLFFEEVGRSFQLLDVYDATLRGFVRLLNAMQVAHPNRKKWRARFHQNVSAFRLRSHFVATHVVNLYGQVDWVLQEGVLFDARMTQNVAPNIIYTDYTAALACQNPEAGRAPYNECEGAEWMELEKQAFERAAHICTRSRLVRNSVIKDSCIPPERVTVIGGGVNLPHWPVPEHSGTRRPTVLFIGKRFYRKGGDLLLRAFDRMLKRIPMSRLLLLTEDPIPPDLPREGVCLVRPTWNRTVIESLYREADLFVLPSRLETWGDVLLEAMAFGLPCIGVTGHAMQEIIENGTTGFVVPQGDVDALADVMACLLSDAPLRRQLGANGRERVWEEFTWEHVSHRLATVLTQLPLIPIFFGTLDFVSSVLTQGVEL